MVTAACPCCSPPTEILKGRSTEFIYVGGRENFNLGTAYAIIWKCTDAGVLTRFYPGTANTSPMASRTVGKLDCDRSGNVYATFLGGTASLADVYSIDSGGTLRWSTVIKQGVSDINTVVAMAVSPDGYVYCGTGTGRIHKLDATTGVEVTGGNWPYVFTGAVTLIGACCDQSGNVYMGGGRVAGTPGNTLISLTPSGTVRWAVDVLGSGETASGEITDIDINLQQTLLTVVKGNTTGTASELFVVNPDTGTFTAADFQSATGTEYSIAGVRYAATSSGLVKNGVVSPVFYQPFQLAPNAFAPRPCLDIAVSRTEDIYMVQFKSGSVSDEGIVRISSAGTKTWGVTMAASLRTNHCVLNSGHMGAWGL